MKVIIIKLFFITGLFLLTKNVCAQNPENWTSKQLMEPSALASILKNEKQIPVIFNIGPGAIIPNSIDIGPAKDSAKLDKLKKQLSGLAKETMVVVYCGCCPFERCPNVRPAIGALKEMNFTNYYLLNLPHNIKTDWIDKHYPVEK
jgi:hypothetical protein